MKAKNTALVAGSAVAMAMLMSGVAFADTTQPQQGEGWGMGRGHGPGMMQRAPGVFGTVSAISGATITVQGHAPGSQAQSSGANTDTTYTVDASNATVTKDGTTSSVGSIAVGDTVRVEGTVSGTNVAATEIHDGLPPRRGMMGEKRGWDGASTTPRGFGMMGAAIQGNGQPVVGGTVTGVSGNTVSITNKSNVSYSIDASGATITKAGATTTIASVQVGDAVLAQGAINGTNVTASSIIDHGAAQQPNAGSGSTQQQGPMMGGFFGRIGGFCRNLFGFF